MNNVNYGWVMRSYVCSCCAAPEFLAGTLVINNASECSCWEIAFCCEYISSLSAGAAVRTQALLIIPKMGKLERTEKPFLVY